ncbi:hypothetical protein TNCV_667351 [Trichonephila clavipes]|nr:hypothetical protein TNCV_667351 [Trichonephila clavipes]
MAVGKNATNYDGEVLAICKATAQLLSSGLAPAWKSCLLHISPNCNFSFKRSQTSSWHMVTHLSQSYIIWNSLLVAEESDGSSFAIYDFKSRNLLRTSRIASCTNHRNSSLPCNKSTDGKKDFRVVKIEAELILEANRLQLMKQDLEKAENAYLSSFTSKKSKTLPGATAAAHGDPNGKNDYQKKSGKVFNCKTIKNVKQSIKTIGPCYVCNKYGHLKVNCKEKKSLPKSPSTVNETFNTEFNINLRFCEAECSLLELDKQLVTSCILFEENSDKGVWVIDTAATSHFCNDKSLFLDLKPITNMKMSLATEDKSCPVEGIGTLRFRVKYKGNFHEITLTDVLFNPKLRRNLLSGSRLESKGAHFVGTKGRKPSVLHLKLLDVWHTLVCQNKLKKKFDMRAKMGIMMGYAQRTKGYRIWLIDENKLVETINFQRQVRKTPSTSEKPDVSSDNHSLIPCTEVMDSKYRKDNTESQGFSDLSEQQEALMVEVTIPICYKQAIRSRDASKWHDAMDKEINVMMERKVWNLVDHPDNIKILENRWVYAIKYDENNKIVRYKARLVARDTDFATNRDDRVSMGGFITFIDETPISSRTFKQNPLVCRPWKLSMLV